MINKLKIPTLNNQKRCSNITKKAIISSLIDEKKASILRIILNSPDELYLKEIAEKSNVPIATAFRILQELITLEILQKREWKTSKVYSPLQNEKVEFLKDLFNEEIDGIKEFLTATQELPNIQNIILHGTRKKDKANLLLIGEGIDLATKDKIDIVCKTIKDKGFEISFLTLTKEQYTQMVKMGLYSGEKKILK